MTTRFLKFFKEIIEWLSQRNFHDFLELKWWELHLAMTLTLELECFPKCNHIFSMVSIFIIDWNTWMRCIHQEFTYFIHGHVQREELNMNSWCHHWFCCCITKWEKILDLSFLFYLDRSSFMWHINKCFEFLTRDLELTMKINLSTKYPTKYFHKYLNKPGHWQENPDEHLIDWSNLECNRIRESHSDNLGCNFSE